MVRGHILRANHMHEEQDGHCHRVKHSPLLKRRSDGVLGGGYDAPHSPDRPHDDFRTPSCSSGLCSSETPVGGGGGGGEFQSLSAAAGPAPESPALPRGHLHTTSWPPSGTAGELNMVRDTSPTLPDGSLTLKAEFPALRLPCVHTSSRGTLCGSERRAAFEH